MSNINLVHKYHSSVSLGDYVEDFPALNISDSFMSVSLRCSN